MQALCTELNSEYFEPGYFNLAYFAILLASHWLLHWTCWLLMSLKISRECITKQLEFTWQGSDGCQVLTYELVRTSTQQS